VDDHHLVLVESHVEEWLRSKGTWSKEEAPSVLVLDDGRRATVVREAVACGSGRTSRWRLEEPHTSGIFRTTLDAALHGGCVHFACSLDLGTPDTFVAPVSYDVFCPGVVHRLLEQSLDWMSGTVPARYMPLRFREGDGGRLVEFIWNPRRTLPVVLVSEFQTAMLIPALDRRIARDLAGLADVASLTEEASWELTHAKGPEWSCFNGAIRLYWPFEGAGAGADAPRSHPLWTVTRMMYGGRDTVAAADWIRGLLRRMVLELSTFTVRLPGAFKAIRSAHREELMQERLEAASEASDYQQLLEVSQEEVAVLRQEMDELESRVEELEAENRQLQAAKMALSHAIEQLRESTEEVAVGDGAKPEPDASPATVAEAVAIARRRHAATLVFGNDVDRGVEGLVASAGPPDRILHYLDELAALTDARRAGPLGGSQVEWLRKRNCEASGESVTVLQNRNEMRKRTWDDGSGQKQRFELHLKPCEAVSPDRCVRIYFLWDDTLGRSIVGWVGRHP
jgi:hypothetical protein